MTVQWKSQKPDISSIEDEYEKLKPPGIEGIIGFKEPDNGDKRSKHLKLEPKFGFTEPEDNSEGTSRPSKAKPTLKFQGLTVINYNK